jgi:hypothetical protein
MAYDVQAWSDLFVACAGAAAALTGLVFVAVSINIERILALPGTPERALQTLLVLLSVVIVSVFCLAPGQSDTAVGVELIAVGLASTVTVALLGRGKAYAGDRGGGALAARAGLLAAGTMPAVTGGISLLAGGGGGLYWVLGGIVAAILGGVINAWVLLVEILR